ncbi:MAG: chemotaxis protein [Idiomarinaceae bacterium]|nr:chemotaxis protein [Idiomarinaceae bacterium]
MLGFNNKLEHLNQQQANEISAYKAMRQTMKDAMVYFALDAQGRIVETDESFKACLGLDSSKLLNQPLSAFIAPTAKNKPHIQQMTRAIKTLSHWHGAIQFTHDQGYEIWIRVILEPEKLGNDSQLAFAAYGCELTHTITKSRETEDLLKALNRSSAVIEFTLDGHVITANENFLDALNYRLDDIVDQHHRVFCSEEEVQSKDYSRFWQKLAAGEFFSGRFQRIDSFGNPVWLEATYNPVHNEAGELYKVVKFASVITDQVKREQAIVETSDIAHDVSTQTDKHAQQGMAVIRETIDAMRVLAQKIEQTSHHIAELNTQSTKVTELVDSIQGIAAQTNLLALNAAIEAARAGEQGRGFAVVADEVRSLASRTSTTSEKIIDVVGKNKNLTETAVQQIQQSLDEVENSLSLSTQASKVMEDIQSGAKHVLDAVSQFKSKVT